MTGKTSGNSTPGVSQDIFRGIQELVYNLGTATSGAPKCAESDPDSASPGRDRRIRPAETLPAPARWGVSAERSDALRAVLQRGQAEQGLSDRGRRLAARPAKRAGGRRGVGGGKAGAAAGAGQ